MAAVKKTGGTIAKTKSVGQKFDKEQIVASAKYRGDRDLVDAILDNGKKYTMEAVNELIEKYKKGQVR